MNRGKYPVCSSCGTHHDGYPAPPSVVAPSAWQVPNPRVKSGKKWKPAAPPTKDEIQQYKDSQNHKPRTKGRKHRKKSEWITLKRIHQNDRCPSCNEVVYNLLIKRGNYRIRAVPEVLFSFKTAYTGLCRWFFPGDLIAKIMFLAFAEDVKARNFGRPIVSFSCGCIYHTKCYEASLKTRHACHRHGANFP